MIAPDAAVSGGEPVFGIKPDFGREPTSGGAGVLTIPFRGEVAQEKKKPRDTNSQKPVYLCISFYRRKIQGN
jgi:hypothetical protein